MRGIEAVKTANAHDADYIVGEPYTISYKLDGSSRQVTVPKGMLTDLASVPRPAWSFINWVGPHLEVSIVHDFLYIAWQDVPGHSARKEDRKFADELMLLGMKKANMSWIKRNAIYSAVRIGGNGAYNGANSLRYVEIL
jgi:hypothetical protein